MFQEKYSQREIINTDGDYYDNGAYLYELGELDREAWEKVDRFYRDTEAMRNMQKCTGSKSFSVVQEEVDGHTKYLQGLNLPIMVNTGWKTENLCIPSKVCEMHIGLVNDKLTL